MCHRLRLRLFPPSRKRDGTVRFHDHIEEVLILPEEEPEVDQFEEAYQQYLAEKAVAETPLVAGTDHT
eukprot:m.229923 g.229923  ORF g.229923 m.229923 type:complete len:68 (+) comp15685_c0_seq9:8508-8711(+)